MQVYSDGKQTFIISSGKVREADCIAVMDKGYEDKAKMLAASPELLMACKHTLEALNNLTTEDYGKGGDGAIRLELINAIAKAESPA